jgi:hypothetical protein
VFLKCISFPHGNVGYDQSSFIAYPLVSALRGPAETLYYLRSHIIRSADRLAVIDASEIM